MERELYTGKDKSVIRRDDLIFDGKKIIIPSYWVDNLCDYMFWCKDKIESLSDGDQQDYQHMRHFLEEVQEYSNSGN